MIKIGQLNLSGIKLSIIIKSLLIILSLIIILSGCGKTNRNKESCSTAKSTNKVKSISTFNHNSHNKITSSVNQKSHDYHATNNHADVSSIIKKINTSRELLSLEERIDDYTAKMFHKSSYKGVDRPKRAEALFRNGEIIFGRILFDKEIADLCKNSLQQVSKDLKDIIDRSFTDCYPGQRLPLEDAIEILKYLIEHGTSDVSLQSQMDLGKYYSHINGYGEKGLNIQKNAIQTAIDMSYSNDKILTWRANAATALLYMDKLEQSDVEAEELLRDYEKSRKNVVKWNESWDALFELFTERISAWKFEDPAHAVEICDKALKVNNSMAIKNGDPLEFKNDREWIIKRFSLDNNK